MMMVLLLVTAAACQQVTDNSIKDNRTTVDNSWQDDVQQQLPLLGHRNWLLIVDKAYPAPNNPDIKIINTGAAMIDVVRQVDSMLLNQPHIRPIIYQDIEFNALDEDLVLGINHYKSELKAVFGARSVQEIPHEEVFKKIEEAARLFKVVVLKTESLLPYTSIFMELDAKYWDAQKEAVLRSKLK